MVTSVDILDRLQRQPEAAASADRQPRREVELRGFAVLPDGTTFGIAVLNLSYDGCKVASELSLLPGLNLKVSILGLAGALDAVVRWSKDGKAGLKFGGDEPAERAQKPRKEERLQLSAAASLRRGGRDSYKTQLFDLTGVGCKIEFIERPKAGELLWVKFAGLEPLEATVRWVDGFTGGLEFVRPIHPAVFDLLLVRLRA